MTNVIKAHVIPHAKRFSVIAFASLLTLTSVVSFAQPDAMQQKQSNTVTTVKTQTAVVYLNNSSREQLETLKGVGHKKAQAIIAYREQFGAFKSVAELIEVKGVGEKVLSDNKARLRI